MARQARKARLVVMVSMVLPVRAANAANAANAAKQGLEANVAIRDVMAAMVPPAVQSSPPRSTTSDAWCWCSPMGLRKSSASWSASAVRRASKARAACLAKWDRVVCLANKGLEANPGRKVRAANKAPRGLSHPLQNVAPGA